MTGIPVFKFSELRNKDEIGRGGFSTVFTAELPSSGEKIVVKKFFDDDIDTERKLFKEARLLNTLRHPNIVKAAFHFRVFHTHVYVRKTLNPSTLYIF